MLDMRIKELFFDKARVVRAVDKARRVVLSKAGAFIRQRAKREPSEAERRRAKRLAKQVMNRLVEPDFLGNRPPLLLGTDLCIAATLMVAGFAEGWLDDELYFQLTHDCWTALFFDDGRAAEHNDEQRGWIDSLHASAADPSSFVTTFAKPGLAAALIMWRHCCPVGSSKKTWIQFELATRFAVARAPWLWQIQDANSVSKEIGRIASAVGWRRPGKGSLEDMLDGWENVVHEGMALRAFEELLRRDPVRAWRDRLRDRTVKARSLVWQGKLGFGVTGNDIECPRDPRQTIPVSLFRASKPATRIQADYLVPFRSLVDVAIQSADADVASRTELRSRLHGLADLLERKSASGST